MENKLKEIIKQRGITQRELARIIWPDSTDGTRDILIKKLIDGKSGINPSQWISVVCSYLKVTPNELFGFEGKSKLTPEQITFHRQLMEDKKVVRVDWVLNTCKTLRISPNDLFNFKK